MFTANVQADNAINGNQLVQEVQDQVSVDISTDYSFYPPRTVQIANHDSDEAAITAVIEAHVPAPPSIPELTDTEMDILSRIANATSLEDLKTAMKTMVNAYPPLV